MSPRRSRHRQRARSAAIVVAIGAFTPLLTTGVATATTSATTTEPQVQIGESRSVERPDAPTHYPCDYPPSEPTVDGEADVAGVAVAGVAIVRAAPPVPGRLESDLTNGNNALPLVIALIAEAAMIAMLWNRSRRAIT